MEGGGGSGEKEGQLGGQCRFEAIVSEVMGLIVRSEGEPGCKNKEEIERRDKKNPAIVKGQRLNDRLEAYG